MADFTKEQAIDKIKKLLRLANGTNFEQEAATAMNMLRDLLAKHNLSMSEIENEDKRVKQSSIDDLVKNPFKQSKGNWQTQLMMVIAEYCKCRVLISSPNNIIIGMPFEVEICSYTYEMLHSQIDKMCKKLRRDLRKERESSYGYRQDRRNSSFNTRGYTMGIIETLKKRLFEREKYEQEKGLIVVEHSALVEYCSRLKRSTSSIGGRGGSGDMYKKGLQDGYKLNISKGISKAKTGNQKLIGG